MTKEETNNDGKNVSATIKTVDIAYENEKLKETNKAQQTQIDLLKKQLQSANDVLNADIRARKINEIIKVSDYTVEDLDKVGIQELDEVLATLRMAKRSFKSVNDLGKTVNPAASMDDLYAPWKKTK